MPRTADRCKDTTITIGTGTITVSGTAPVGYQSFGTGFEDGAIVRYVIKSAAQWEVVTGAWDETAKTLTRDKVHASSNAGALVNFSAGSKEVFSDIPAYLVNAISTRGYSLASEVVRAFL
jgi:hypothetical protein